ncbi:2-isopropylmalate synthase [Rhodovibrio sodomensis]|uniref:2-isopropylmalate synthase n=1 Tax=Rhodovibrio sodomensis TaxID=1088 RepID=A0ABS1DDB1_9PROT|nr:2-isopropylmalate synthase [Rhodovibrio sodomensis]MBK1668443.1 2-isopropylmalate synthase [Rhodovibrio sodomensis]
MTTQPENHTTPAHDRRFGENHITIFDTTLRDGEQSPGCSMNKEEKVQVAKVLDAMGVGVIEGGFPVSSNSDFEAVSEIAQVVQNAQVAGLARARPADIDRAWQALQHAANPRIHTFLSTSPLHMKYKLQMDPEDVYQAVIDSVTYARNLCPNVEWSPEDGTRTDHAFLCRCVEAAITAGARTINIPDTVGYTVPDEFRDLIRMLRNRVPNMDQAIISVHCHNDLGLAVANSLAAVEAGARQVECTINGIGERAGNAALEEIVMALKTRQDMMPYDTNVDSTYITKASRLVSGITGFNVQPNKAIVGRNAFAHESGIHQDGMLKNAETYEIMTPESVGLKRSTLVMGRHSGKHAFKTKLKELGYELSDNELKDAFQRFKDLAEHKKEVFDEDLLALVDDAVLRHNDHIRFVRLGINCGNDGPQTADLELEVEGARKRVTAEGSGPVDATFTAIRQIWPHEATLELYQVHAVTGGTDAQAEVTVRLEEDGKTVNGQGADYDTLVASARAYVNALNKLMVKRQKSVPPEEAADALSA